TKVVANILARLRVVLYTLIDMLGRSVSKGRIAFIAQYNRASIALFEMNLKRLRYRANFNMCLSSMKFSFIVFIDHRQVTKLCIDVANTSNRCRSISVPTR